MNPALREIGHERRDVQRRACEAVLESAASDPELIHDLTTQMRKGTAVARFGAVWVLFRVRRPTLALLPALLDALSLPDGDRRWEAAQMLATLGRIEPQVIPAVRLDAIGASCPARRRMSLFVLRELAPGDPESEATFVQALGDTDSHVRRAALASFAKLEPSNPHLLERALEILTGDADLRMRALATIVVAELANALPFEYAAQRRDVARTLSQVSERHPELAHACELAQRRMENPTPKPSPFT